MPILILSNNTSGLFSFRKELIATLINRGDKVVICAPNDSRTAYFVEMGCEFRHINVDRRGVNPFADLRLLIQYLSIIRHYKPRAVLTYTVKPNVFGGMAARILSTPYIANVTGLGAGIEDNEMLRPVVTALYRIGLAGASRVFLQNGENLAYLRKNNIRPGALRLIPGSGVNTDEFSFSTQMPATPMFKIAFIGRIMRTRGIHEFLAAAEHVKQLGYKVVFPIYGRFDENIRPVIEAAHDKGVINYKGVSQTIKDELLNVNAVVVPSYYEGMSNSVLEAGARGRALIGSNISGIREIIEDGVTGFLCEPMNSESLAAAIIKLLEMPKDERLLMAKAARKKIEQAFDRKIIISEYLEALDLYSRAGNELDSM